MTGPAGWRMSLKIPMIPKVFFSRHAFFYGLLGKVRLTGIVILIV